MFWLLLHGYEYGVLVFSVYLWTEQRCPLNFIPVRAGIGSHVYVPTSRSGLDPELLTQLASLAAAAKQSDSPAARRLAGELRVMVAGYERAQLARMDAGGPRRERTSHGGKRHLHS